MTKEIQLTNDEKSRGLFRGISLFGLRPVIFTSLKTEDLVITKKTTYVYRQGKDTVTIVFKDDKVQSKDSTLSD